LINRTIVLFKQDLLKKLIKDLFHL